MIYTCLHMLKITLLMAKQTPDPQQLTCPEMFVLQTYMIPRTMCLVEERCASTSICHQTTPFCLENNTMGQKLTLRLSVGTFDLRK